MNDIIHDRHDALQQSEADRLNEAGRGQEQVVLDILRSAPDYRFAYFEIIDRTGYDKDSAKRALSNLSGSASHERYLDKYGNWPVIYRSDKRKKNPNTGTTCGTYAVNPVYGVRPARQPETDPQGQVHLFGPKEPKSKAYDI